MRLHRIEAERLEERLQLRHRNCFVAADIDAAKECDEGGHGHGLSELSSSHGLTMGSILESYASIDGYGMDCRVKPGNDDKC